MLLNQVLEKTLSQSTSDQKSALQYLEQARESNFPQFVHQLSELLKNPTTNDFVRTAAGLQLKNALAANDRKIQLEKAQRWLQTPANIRDAIKFNILSTLGTEKTRPSTAAQCVSRVACIELPNNSWSNLIPDLMQAVTDNNSSEQRIEASLEALGYICLEITDNASTILSQSNQILTAIVRGMAKENSAHVRLAATNALSNSLAFIEQNFANQMERNVIMQYVCEATQCPEQQVKVAALQCLGQIVAIYYEHMEEYMARALFPIVLDAMRSNQEDVVLQGIEFWTSICEEEMNLRDMAEEAEQVGETPKTVSKHYAKGAAPHILPILTECLCKQEEDADEGEWNVSKSAAVCLGLFSQTIEDEIVPQLIPFITANIGEQDWRRQEASLMAFGTILDGPDPQNLRPLVIQAMPHLIQSLANPKIEVRDTAAWTCGRAFDICESLVQDTDILAALLPALAQGLTQEPRVAANVCWAVTALTKAAYSVASKEGENNENDQPRTYILSSCFQQIIDQLMAVTDRTDGNQSNLRISAYETLMEMMRHSPQDCYSAVQSTTMAILSKIQSILQFESQAIDISEKQQIVDLQSLLCNMLTSVLTRVTVEDAEQISELCMQAILQMIQKSGEAIMDDALQTISALINKLTRTFSRYLDVTMPLVVQSLKNHEKIEICANAIGIVTDLCAAFGSDFAPQLDQIMVLLGEILQDPNIDKTIQPQVLSAFGDIAIAIGPAFARYADTVLNVLFQASQTQITDKEDVDQVDFVMSLWDECLGAYTGIITSVKQPVNVLQQQQQIHDPSHLATIHQHLPNIIRFLTVLASDALFDSVLAAAVGLVGDLVSAYGAAIIQHLDTEPINKLVNRARRSKSNKAKMLGNYATKEMRRIRNQTTNTSLGLAGVPGLTGSLAEG